MCANKAKAAGSKPTAGGENGAGAPVFDSYSTTEPVTTQQGELLEAAMGLWQRGAAVVPIPRAGIAYTDQQGNQKTTNGKGPILKNWQSRRLGRDELRRLLTSGNGDIAGIGVIAGRMSGNRVCLDFDGEGWKGAFENFVAAWDEVTGTPIAETGSRRRHIWVRCPDLPGDVTNHPYSRPDLGATIELRANRSNVVMPPSLHPSGNRYRWLTSDATLVDIPYEDLRRWLAEWAGEPDETTPKGPAPAIADRIPAGSRNQTLTSMAGTIRRRGAGELEIKALLSETNRLRCDPPLPDEEVAQIAASVARYAPAAATTPTRQQEAAPAASAPVPARSTLDAYTRNEAGDADLFARMFTGQVAYDHAERTWHTWRGHYWRVDDLKSVVNLVCGPLAARFLEAAAMQRELGEDADEDLIKGLIKRAGALQYRNRVNNVLMLATSHPDLALAGDEWDRDPWLLGCVNGVLDLRTGVLRPGRPGDYIRAVCPTPWGGIDTPAQRWEHFLEEIFGGDGDLVAFVKRLLGCSLIGAVVERVLPIPYGIGGNGKDVLFNVVGRVLGPDLAGPIETGVLLDRPTSANGATPSLYALRSKRIVWCSETNEGVRLNAAQVKLLTGGGAFQARPLYGAPVTVKPQYTPWLMTNHKPHAPADDVALWDRLLLIPFTQRFVDDPQAAGEHKRDPHLADKLAEEAPGILASLVLGCLDWQAHGLTPPAAVCQATSEYRADEDELGHFFEECCTLSPAALVQAKTLHVAYMAWCAENGIHRPMTVNKLGRRLRARGYESYTNNGVWYIGIGLAA